MLWVALLVAQVPFPVEGFTRPIAEPPTAARACGACHQTQYASWSRSWHRRSLTSAVFLDGFAEEPHYRCVVCHAPLEAQTNEAWAQRERLRRGDARGLSEAAHDGVTCVTCHVRDGLVRAPADDALPYSHPLRVEPSLRTSAFCANCHEFTGHSVIDGRTELNAFAVQTTFSEWKAWGGAATCQGCHMPNASHEVKGGHDPGFVRSALVLSVKGRVATVRVQNTGHRVPTGDVFRHLVLWADDTPVRRWGLTLALGVDAEGREGVRIAEDTRLWPDAEVSVALPAGTREVRLTYHFTNVSARERVGLTREDELFVVHVIHLKGS